jgi:NADH:ubiquinone oxidoreductase subunit 6 (subunit J)
MTLGSIQLLINLFLILLIILYTLSVIVVTRIYSVITLILSYIIVSVIALLYHQSFIAVVLLMIYAGAISIFFIFMVMLLNTQRRGTGAVKLTLGGLLLFFILFALIGELIIDNFYNMIKLSYNGAGESGLVVGSYTVHIHNIRDFINLIMGNYSKLEVPIKFVDLEDSHNDFVGKGFFTSQLARIGLALYSAYIYGFIGAGLLLLVAIVGVTSLFNYTPRLQKSREVDSLQILRGINKK